MSSLWSVLLPLWSHCAADFDLSLDHYHALAVIDPSSFLTSGNTSSFSRSLAAAFQKACDFLHSGVTNIFRKYSLHYIFQFANKTTEENQAQNKCMWKPCWKAPSGWGQSLTSNIVLGWFLSSLCMWLMVIFCAACLLESLWEYPRGPCQNLAKIKVFPAMKSGLSCQIIQWCSSETALLSTPGSCDNAVLLIFCWTFTLIEMISVVDWKTQWWCVQDKWV